IMSGDYNLHYYNKNIDNAQEIENAKDFFANRYENEYLDDDGYAQWQNFTTKETYTMSKMRTELDNGKPVVVLGNKTCGDDKTRHAALVVAYTGNGTSLSSFTVIDPWYSVVFPTTYYEFHNRYPHPTTLGGLFNPMLIFK
ncbi:MAG: C39 family peptidase, partial [Oscillospiraceae bacterium]|nr:C39 family peptidase [Oscillospiraceae bacterium]